MDTFGDSSIFRVCLILLGLIETPPLQKKDTSLKYGYEHNTYRNIQFSE